MNDSMLLMNRTSSLYPLKYIRTDKMHVIPTIINSK